MQNEVQPEPISFICSVRNDMDIPISELLATVY